MRRVNEISQFSVLTRRHGDVEGTEQVVDSIRVVALAVWAVELEFMGFVGHYRRLNFSDEEFKIAILADGDPYGRHGREISSRQ